MSTVSQFRNEIKRIAAGESNKLLVICGPCSISDQASALHYAKSLKLLADQHRDELFIVMRTYFSKPRSVGGWKGLINDPDLNGCCDIEKGYALAKEILVAITQLGLPCATEFVDPMLAAELQPWISWGTIGARTVESQLHRELASSLTMPIGFKNNTMGDIHAAVNAVKNAQQPHTFYGIENHQVTLQRSSGNKHTHIILRGGKLGTNYQAEHIHYATQLLRQNHLAPYLMIDCSHGNSQKNHLNQLHVAANVAEQITAGNKNIMGLMLESNVYAGSQAASTPIKAGLSLTDECISLEQTSAVLAKLAMTIKDRAPIPG